jgi:uncharacterized membrane protein YwzB
MRSAREHAPITGGRCYGAIMDLLLASFVLALMVGTFFVDYLRARKR